MKVYPERAKKPTFKHHSRLSESENGLGYQEVSQYEDHKAGNYVWCSESRQKIGRQE